MCMSPHPGNDIVAGADFFMPLKTISDRYADGLPASDSATDGTQGKPYLASPSPVASASNTHAKRMY